MLYQTPVVCHSWRNISIALIDVHEKETTIVKPFAEGHIQ